LPEQNVFEVEVVLKKKHKSLGIDKIPAELIKARRTIRDP
jgi:hypothetical protein